MLRRPWGLMVWLFAVGTALWPAIAQDIRYEKYKLDNGMTVILHEDHSLPVATINLWYRVGSKDEPLRRSGFAHLFEHLMFMGTERVPGNKFDTIMESGGGENNASTSSDRTNYFSSGPSELLPTLLWLDADRLEDLGRMMDQEKLDKQRDIVRNERRQSYENRPYGRAELKIQEMMFPPGHPYHYPVIGTHEDLEAATVNDVKEFFATYYVPNNVTLVVAGDFDPAKVKPVVAGLFSDIPRASDAPHRAAAPVRLDGVQRATMLDKVQLPLVAMAFHSPAWYADGDAEMDLAAAVLSQGKTSRLYKRLIYDDKIAVEVNADQDSGQLGSTFRIDVLAQPGASLDLIEKTVDEEVARFVHEGPTKDELEQRKATIELSMLSGLQTIQAKADQLNKYDYIWGEPNSFKRDLDRYRNATVDNVRTWAGKVLTPDARVIVRVLPEAPQHAESTRDSQPAPELAAPFGIPAPQTFKLANGVSVMLWPKPEIPLVGMTMLFLRQGELPDEVERAGAMSLTANMLDEGAGELDALQFGDAMQMLGARFGTGGDRESITLSLTVLKRNLERATRLMADAAVRPRLDPKEWDRVKRLHLEDLKQDDDQPTAVASRVASRALYGDKHPYGWPVSGTPDTVGKLTLDDIKTFHAARVRPEFLTILVAGDTSVDEVKPLLEQTIGSWKMPTTPASKSAEHDVPARKALDVVLVNRPGAVQTVIQFIMPGPKYVDPKRVQYRLLNTLFGGSFTSRLNMNLREQHGFTYGARSNFAMRADTGYVVAASSVRAEVTGQAVSEFLTEIKRLRGGDISDEEAAKARETLRINVVQSFQGLRGILAEAVERVVNHLPFETLATDVKNIQAATAADLNALADSAIPLERGVLVLVGDKQKILEQLSGLDLATPVELDIRGNRLGS